MGKEKFNEKQHAKLLFLYSNLSREQIAIKTNTSLPTLRNWIKTGSWDKLKGFELEQMEVAKEYLLKLSELAKQEEVTKTTKDGVTTTSIDKSIADRAAKYSAIVRNLSANNLNTDDLLKALSRILDWVEIHKAADDAKQIATLIEEYALYISDK